ncbi:MAG: hypothetical protein GOV00_03740 [Candidatus Altiarchaeota archaeon]|nr:hypothetical protein [Candidatus Altiarchaeota archaeon]
MVDLYWEKGTADAVLRSLSFILILEGVLLWLFSYNDAVIIFTGFMVFLVGDLGLLLDKSSFWGNLFDRDFHRAQKAQKVLEKTGEGVVVEAKLKASKKKSSKRKKKKKK